MIIRIKIAGWARLLIVDAVALAILVGLQANTIRDFLLFVGGVSVGLFMLAGNDGW